MYFYCIFSNPLKITPLPSTMIPSKIQNYNNYNRRNCHLCSLSCSQSHPFSNLTRTPFESVFRMPLTSYGNITLKESQAPDPIEQTETPGSNQLAINIWMKSRSLILEIKSYIGRMERMGFQGLANGQFFMTTLFSLFYLTSFTNGKETISSSTK